LVAVVRRVVSILHRLAVPAAATGSRIAAVQAELRPACTGNHVAPVEVGCQQLAHDGSRYRALVVVPTAPGGTLDLLGRLLGEQIGKAQGQTMVVEDRPGASM
jgi:hypothetical protein